MSLTPLTGDINTLAIHHGALKQVQEMSLTNAVRIESVVKEIDELRNEKRVEGDIQEAIINLQLQLEDIRNVYVKRVDALEREVVNCKLYISQFIKEMEKKYPVDPED